MAVYWGTADETHQVPTHDGMEEIPDCCADDIRAGVDCFLCGSVVAFPAVVWMGMGHAIYLHAECAARLSAGLMVDWKIIADGRAVWQRSREHARRMNQREREAEAALKAYEETVARLEQAVSEERSLRAQAQQERRILQSTLIAKEADHEVFQPVRLDPQRNFSDHQKKEIYLRCNGHCQGCGADLGGRWHADHIQPHSRGGKTEVINGQSLCQPCNSRKHAKVLTVEG